MCTMLDEMRTENWAGITTQLGNDINTMLRDNNMNPDRCPQPPQQMSIVEHPIQMPAMPSILSFFADVSTHHGCYVSPACGNIFRNMSDARETAIYSFTGFTLYFRKYERVVRKPSFCICENKDADQLRGNREADQRLCFRYTDSIIPLLPKSEISSV